MRLGRKAALAVGSGALTAACGGLAGLSMPAAAAAATAPAAATGIRPVPLAAGHVIKVAGKMAQPPTTAQCEKQFGIACYQPFQLQRAYNLAPLFSRGIEGQGQTIVIVDAFGSPSIASDLQTFDAQLGLPNPPSFQVITPAGPITTNPKNCTSKYSPTGPDLCSDYYGWTDETSLDVEWSHVMAPQANILLVETPVTETEGIYGFPQIVAAENYVINHHLGDVISQSFGANEQTFTSPGQIYSLRSAYINAARHGVTVLAASGDNGSTNYVLRPELGLREPERPDLLLLNPDDFLAPVGPAGHGRRRHPAAPQRQGIPDRPGQRLERPQLHARDTRARLHGGGERRRPLHGLLPPVVPERGGRNRRRQPGRA